MAMTGCKGTIPLQRGKISPNIDLMKDPYMRCTGIIQMQGYMAETPDNAKVWLRTLRNCSPLLANTSVAMSFWYTFKVLVGLCHRLCTRACSTLTLPTPYSS
jgi:hypothetical protein